MNRRLIDGDEGLMMRSVLPMQTIWPHVIERHGGEVDAKFDYSTLAHISEGYSSGTIDQVSAGHAISFAMLACSKPRYNAQASSTVDSL